jgi:hypothetical protein
MKINFPRITRPLDLGEYAPEMQGQSLQVWVNPLPDDVTGMLDNYKLSLSGNGKGETAWSAHVEALSVLLSQGGDDTHLSPADLQELRDGTIKTDPAFWPWLINGVMDRINAYRSIRKKA